MSPPKSNQPSGKHETPNQEDYDHDGDRDDESGFGVHEEEAPSGSSRPGTSRRENESDNDEVLPP